MEEELMFERCRQCPPHLFVGCLKGPGPCAKDKAEDKPERQTGTEKKPPTGKLTKEEVLNYIQSLPDGLDAFSAELTHVIDIRIFPTPKGEEFYKWYFGI